VPTVTYGRITAVSQGSAPATNAQTAGTVGGGAVGLISGAGRSGSNQALRTETAAEFDRAEWRVRLLCAD
jgi:outer membrane lipoprotein SlyB